VAVVSRGYGRETSGTMVVSDAQEVRLNVRQAGDEPLMLARRLPGVPVVVSENRYRGILEAKQKFDIQCAILDDAFQHRKIHRDLDIVVIDVRQFSAWTSSRIGVPHLLPVGPLREPIKNLSRADMIILTHARSGGGHTFLREQIQRLTRAPIFEASYRSSEMIFLNTGAKRPIQDLDQVPVVAFAGIAYPDSFFQSIEDRGADLTGKFSFPDHHFFTENELNEIASHAHQTRAEFVITTEKDAMRLLDRTLPFPLYMIPVEVEISSGTEMLVEMMQQKKIIDKTGVATGRNSKVKDTVK
jgi:tetraacyldisaccharide 4'-kinase